MFRSSSSHPILFIAFIIVLLLVSSLSMAQNYVAPSTPVIQNTNISSATTTTAGSNITTDTKQFSWPFDLTYDFSANPDGSFQQYSKADQQFQKGVRVKLNGKQSYSSSYSDEVTPTDTLMVDANGNVTTQGQANTETYQYSNSNGACWNERIRAAAGVLTSVHGGSCAH